jgi:hypothetical protein
VAERRGQNKWAKCQNGQQIGPIEHPGCARGLKVILRSCWGDFVDEIAEHC